MCRPKLKPHDWIWSPVHAGVRRYFHPHDIFTPGWKYRYDIFTPSTIFSPPTISDGISYCSQISWNYIMCLYNQESFLCIYGFYSSQTVLTLYLNLSTQNSEILSFNSKEDSMCKFSWLNMNIYIIKHLGIFTLQSQIWGVKIFKYNHPQCQIVRVKI